MGELAPEGSRRPTAPRAQAPRAAPHLLLGCSRLCRYMKFTSSLLMSLHLKREGAGAAVSSGEQPAPAVLRRPREPPQAPHRLRLGDSLRVSHFFSCWCILAALSYSRLRFP